MPHCALDQFRSAGSDLYALAERSRDVGSDDSVVGSMTLSDVVEKRRQEQHPGISQLCRHPSVVPVFVDQHPHLVNGAPEVGGDGVLVERRQLGK